MESWRDLRLFWKLEKRAVSSSRACWRMEFGLASRVKVSEMEGISSREGRGESSWDEVAWV